MAYSVTTSNGNAPYRMSLIFLRFRLGLPVQDLSGGLGGLTLPGDIADLPTEENSYGVACEPPTDSSLQSWFLVQYHVCCSHSFQQYNCQLWTD